MLADDDLPRHAGPHKSCEFVFWMVSLVPVIATVRFTSPVYILLLSVLCKYNAFALLCPAASSANDPVPCRIMVVLPSP
jgi:hypothetical protein